MISFVNDESLLTNVRKCKRNVMMMENLRKKEISKQGGIIYYRELYFDPDAVANIFGLSDKVQKGD